MYWDHISVIIYQYTRLLSLNPIPAASFPPLSLSFSTLFASTIRSLDLLVSPPSSGGRSFVALQLRLVARFANCVFNFQSRLSFRRSSSGGSSGPPLYKDSVFSFFLAVHVAVVVFIFVLPVSPSVLRGRFFRMTRELARPPPSPRDGEVSASGAS